MTTRINLNNFTTFKRTSQGASLFLLLSSLLHCYAFSWKDILLPIPTPPTPPLPLSLNPNEILRRALCSSITALEAKRSEIHSAITKNAADLATTAAKIDNATIELNKLREDLQRRIGDVTSAESIASAATAALKALTDQRLAVVNEIGDKAKQLAGGAITVFDETTPGNLSINLNTYSYFAAAVFPYGLKYSTAQLKALMAGTMSIPDISAEQVLRAAGKTYAISITQANGYDEFKRSRELESEKAFFPKVSILTSQAFSDWACMETVINKVVQEIYTAGGATSGICAETKTILYKEMERVICALLITGASCDNLGESFVSMAKYCIDPLNFSGRGDVVKPHAVPYRIDVSLANTYSHGNIGKIAYSVRDPHLAFEIRTGLRASKVKIAALKERLGKVDVDFGAQLSSRLEKEIAKISKFAQLDAGILPLLQKASGSMVRGNELMSTNLMQSIIACVMTSEDPKLEVTIESDVVKKQLAALLSKLCVGNTNKHATIKSLTVDLLTGELVCDYTARHHLVLSAEKAADALFADDRNLKQVGDAVGEYMRRCNLLPSNALIGKGLEELKALNGKLKEIEDALIDAGSKAASAVAILENHNLGKKAIEEGVKAGESSLSFLLNAKKGLEEAAVELGVKISGLVNEIQSKHTQLAKIGLGC